MQDRTLLAGCLATLALLLTPTWAFSGGESGPRDVSVDVVDERDGYVDTWVWYTACMTQTARSAQVIRLEHAYDAAHMQVSAAATSPGDYSAFANPTSMGSPGSQSIVTASTTLAGFNAGANVQVTIEVAVTLYNPLTATEIGKLDFTRTITVQERLSCSSSPPWK